jgi:hypothetical protein
MEMHDLFLQSLSAEDEQLLVIRDFLYDGDWEEVIQDLRSRQSGKPFIFKLNTRIDEDLKRIDRLRGYERAHEVDLGKLLLGGGKFPELARRMVGEKRKDAENRATRT